MTQYSDVRKRGGEKGETKGKVGNGMMGEEKLKCLPFKRDTGPFKGHRSRKWNSFTHSCG